MKRPVTILTDVLPLNLRLQRIKDFAGLQLLSPTGLPLLRSFEDQQDSKVEGLGSESWLEGPKRLEFRINSKNRFSDGLRVRASHYQRSIEYLKTHQSGFYSLLFPVLESAYAKGDLLRIQFRYQSPLWKFAFTCLTTSPLHPDGMTTAGSYFLASHNSHGMNLKRNLNFDLKSNIVNAISEINICSKSSRFDPYGLLRFHLGTIDLTCSTAFPFDRFKQESNNPQLRRERSGVFVALVPGTVSHKIDDMSLRIIRTGINQKELLKHFSNLPYMFEGYSRNAVLPQVRSGRCKKRGPNLVSVGYEHFYPNLEILKFLSTKLSSKKVQLQLKRRTYGDFKSPSNLVLKLYSSPIAHHYPLYLFHAQHERFKLKSPKKYKEFMGVLSNYMQVDSEITRKLLAREMDQILCDSGELIPLLEMPAITLKRKELNHCSFGAGKVWMWNSK